ncbi:reverse transcriptase domain-containing protein, partial [Tanacetum coccineum]
MIIVMICRSWDVHTITGRYGNAIYSFAKANVAHNFLKLKEGLVYPINNFVVQANKEEYRIFRDHAYMIELDGTASVRKTFVKGGGFIQYPFQLAKLDVARYVTNVGRITHQKTGSRTIDFSLANDSGQAIRVTLWGGLEDALVERKTNNVGLYPMVLTVMNVNLYNKKLYLSRGSFSHILDDPQILALKALRAENSQAAVHADYSQAKEGTLENLLIWAQNRRNDVSLQPSNAESRLMASGHKRDGTSHPVVVRNVRKELYEMREVSGVRFRIKLDVSDKTASTVVVMFDEPATELVKCFADSLAAANEDRIALEEVVEEDAGSSNVNTYPDINIKQSKRLATKLIVAALSKPTEERGKRYIVDDSTS